MLKETKRNRILKWLNENLMLTGWTEVVLGFLFLVMVGLCSFVATSPAPDWVGFLAGSLLIFFVVLTILRA